MHIFNKLFKKNTPVKDTAVDKQASTASKPTTPIILTAADIALDLQATDKADAINQIANLLIAKGKVTEAYKTAMQQREKEVSTYLVNGVAIPHGTRDALGAIIENALFIAQFKDGVLWSEAGDKVYLACAIASNGEAHLEILGRLSVILQEEALVQRLVQTNDKADILHALNGEVDASTLQATHTPDTPTDALTHTLLFTGENGMHARPAALLVKMAKSYTQTESFLCYADKQASLKQLASLLALGIMPNSEITLKTHGTQAQEALDALTGYINNTLNLEKKPDIKH